MHRFARWVIFKIRIMKNELISMVSFVLAQHHRGNGNHTVGDEVISFHSVLKYANFLNTPLNLGMFVPAIEVDGKWEVLEWKEPYQEGNVGNNRQYQQAKDKVIFEGFKEFEFNNHRTIKMIDNHVFIAWFEGYKYVLSNGLKTIQDLIKYKPTLTKKGLEVSGLNR